jgi:hypothetical protein
MSRTFETNLRCQSCVASIAPTFDNEPAIESWHADVQNPGTLLTVEGKHVTKELVDGLLRKAGYQVLNEVSRPPIEPVVADEPKRSFYPLLLIASYLVGATGLIELTLGSWDLSRAMTNFMAGFFLVFSFFKLLDVQAFADAFSSYDVLASRSQFYGLAYPFLELGLGVAYLTRFWPTATNAATLALMSVGAVGVIKSLAARRKIRCACLGAVFNLPMTFVTLVEDALMIAMAAWMLLLSHH